jgi:hypothetical protein
VTACAPIRSRHPSVHSSGFRKRLVSDRLASVACLTRAANVSKIWNATTHNGRAGKSFVKRSGQAFLPLPEMRGVPACSGEIGGRDNFFVDTGAASATRDHMKCCLSLSHIRKQNDEKNLGYLDN